MAFSLTRYNVLLSSPGDAIPYCDIADKTICAIDRTHSKMTHVDFHPIDWRRDSSADSGAEPQELINRQLVDDADIVLAVFVERFGSKTKKYGSGTEEEICRALDQGKRVMLYIWQPPSGYVPEDENQYKKIGELRNRLGDQVLYRTFSTEQDFEDFVRHDFTSLMFRLEGSLCPTAPLLSIISPDGNGEYREGSLSIVSDGATARLNPKPLDDRITSLFESILNIKLEKPLSSPLPSGNQENALAANYMKMISGKPAFVSDARRELISDQLGAMGLVVPEHFFNLGGLRLSSFPAIANIEGPSYMGTEEEKKKRELIAELGVLCTCRRDYLEFLREYEDVDVVSLAIKNSGGTPASNVCVELTIPAGSVIDLGKLPTPSDQLISELLDETDYLEYFVDLMFGNSERQGLRSYWEAGSLSGAEAPEGPIHAVREYNPLYGRMALDSCDFENALARLFSPYKVVKNADGSAMIRVIFQRVQHGGSYLFPALIPVRHGVRNIDACIYSDEIEKAVSVSLVGQG